MSPYTSATDADRKAMLDAIGVGSLDELFSEIPEAVRLHRPLDIPAGKSETEVFDHLSALAARNVHADAEVSFLGAGMYDHYVPAIIDSILSRSEFLTPYTPYQPEISQGGLQVMFEFQTAISELTGLPVSNASVYEGPSAVAAAGYLAKLETKRTKLVVSRGLHPHSRDALATHAAGYGMTVDEAGLTAEGATDVDALAALVDDDTAAVFVQQPNFLGTVEDVAKLGEAAKRTGALFVVAADPLPLGILEAPGRQGADIWSARARPWATGSTSAGRRSASSPPPSASSARCRAGSPARRATWTASAASCSRSRRASSTSAARRPRTTSAPRRR